MQVRILGSGCPNCRKLYEITQKVVKNFDEQIKVEYVTGVEGSVQIAALGLMISPVLMVNDKVAMTGFTPDEAKISQAIVTALKA